jgi:hypothetical protein
VLFNVAMQLVTGLLDALLFGEDSIGLVNGLYTLAVLLPTSGWACGGCTTSTAAAGGCWSPSSRCRLHHADRLVRHPGHRRREPLRAGPDAEERFATA